MRTSRCAIVLLLAAMSLAGCAHLIYTADGPANAYIAGKTGAYLAVRLSDVSREDVLMVRTCALKVEGLLSASPEELPSTLRDLALTEGEKLVPEIDRPAYRDIMADIFLHVESEGAALDDKQKATALLTIGGIIDGLNLALEVYATEGGT